jgi:peptide-methionine (S)-S-oxide reductase
MSVAIKSASPASRWRQIGGVAALAVALAGAWQVSRASETVYNIAPPKVDEQASGKALEKAVIAGGCFWGVQAVFQHVNGVKNAVSGYAGGDEKTAQYRTISSGQTGHAEAVEISYDPSVVSYGQLLQIFFSVAHDPTQLNRQGPDTGTQYRSTIFPANAEQTKVATAYIEQLNQSGVYPKKIATTTEPLKGFYKAEDYHQDYLVNNPYQPYIVINDKPKVENLAKTFPQAFRKDPVLVAGQSR